MGWSYCGIDPSGLATLALQLDWVQADIDRQAGRAYERLTRHSRWATADGVGTSLSGTARWGRLEAEDLRGRVDVIVTGQSAPLSGPLASGPWPLPQRRGEWGSPLADFPFGSPGDYANAAAIPWDDIEEWVRGALGIWNGRSDDTFPIGRWIGGLLYLNRVQRFLRSSGPLPTVANGWVMRQLATSSHFRWINNPGVQALGRRASIGLSAYSTVSDGIVVWNHGNPIEAFDEHGAGYVADVARLGFSASTTAFLIAPNPVTGGIVIVTGIVWAGAEVVDHWDEITEFVGDVYSGAEDGVVWVYNEAGDLLETSWDWTSRRWDDFEGWAGETWDDIDEWGHSRLDDLSRGVDRAGDRLDDAADWTGDRLEDLGNVGGSIVDTGLEAGGDLLDGAGSLIKKIPNPLW